MKKYNKVELEIGFISDQRQGVDWSRPAAVVKIETEDDDLLNRILSALSHVEDYLPD